MVATYPVHVYADVPAQTNPNSPTSASPQTATDRQLALMRAIARDDANGVVDRGVWRPGSGAWYVQGSATQWWGAPNDVPLNIAPAVRLKRFA